MAANHKRQQRGAADLSSCPSAAVQPDRKCGCADDRAKYDGGDNKNGIPQDDARNFHRGNAARHEGATDPWAEAPIRNDRHREPRAGEKDRRDQRQEG